MGTKRFYCMVAAGMALAASAEETEGLRRQVESLSIRLAELENAAGAGGPEAASAPRSRLAADVRIRYGYRDVSGEPSQSRMLFRARAGLYGSVAEELHGGIRVASGANDQATSTNDGFGEWASEKKAWIDLAYIGYAPRYAEGLDLSIGKIEKPWIDLDSMYWDGDVNPEGASLAYRRDAGPVNLFTHGGYFIMDEGGNDDTSLSSAQLAAKGNLRENIALRLGGTAFLWQGGQPAHCVIFPL